MNRASDRSRSYAGTHRLSAIAGLVVFLSLAALALLLQTACGKKAPPPASTEQAHQEAAPVSTASSPDQPPAPSNVVTLPVDFGRRTGDLDEMVKSRNIRARPPPSTSQT